MIRTSALDSLDKEDMLDPPLLQPRSSQRLHRHRQQPQQSLAAAGCERYMDDSDNPNSSEFLLLHPASAKFHRTPPPAIHRRTLIKPSAKPRGTVVPTKREAEYLIEARRCVFMPLSSVTHTGTSVNEATLTAPRSPVFPHLGNTEHHYKLKPRRSSRTYHDWTNANAEYKFHDQKPVVVVPIPAGICMPALLP